MKLNILHHAQIAMGERGEYKNIAIDYKEGETIESLVSRVLKSQFDGKSPVYHEHIEIRIIPEQ